MYVCDDEGYAVITSMNLDGSDKRIIAEGIRNSVGMTFHPITGELWFTDNGRDMLGDDIPPCELNKLSYEGEHFGSHFVTGMTSKIHSMDLGQFPTLPFQFKN